MKRELIVEVSTGDSLKVKRRTIVHTRELEEQVDDGEEDQDRKSTRLNSSHSDSSRMPSSA